MLKIYVKQTLIQSAKKNETAIMEFREKIHAEK